MQQALDLQKTGLTNLLETGKRLVQVRYLLWSIYLSLLAVLLPHTAWWFSRSQKPDSEYLAWLLAFVFEASVFGFTHNLVERLEHSAKLRKREGENTLAFWFRRFSSAYVNLNSFGLLVVSLVSALANFSYSVEFAQPFKVYTEYSVPPFIYHLAAGGILPFVGLMFANILARLAPIEEGPSESEQQAKAAAAAARKELSILKDEFGKVNNQLGALKAELERAKVGEAGARGESERLRDEVERLGGELQGLRESTAEIKEFRILFEGDKLARILAARSLWPGATGAAIASITGTSAGYVSEVLNGMNGKG